MIINGSFGGENIDLSYIGLNTVYSYISSSGQPSEPIPKATGFFSLFVQVVPKPQDSLNLFLKAATGCSSGVGNCPDIGFVFDSLNLYTSGSLSNDINNSFTLYLPVRETTGVINNSVTLYTSGPVVNSGLIPLFIPTFDAPSGNIPLVIKAGEASGFSYSSVNLFINSVNKISTNNTTTLFLKTFPTGTISGNIPLFLQGKVLEQSQNNVDLYLFNEYPSGNIPLYIKGYWWNKTLLPEMLSAIYPIKPYWAHGSIPVSSTIPMYVEVIGSDINSNIPLFIKGAIPSSGTMPLYVRGANIASGVMPLHSSGIEHINDNLTLHIDGTVGPSEEP